MDATREIAIALVRDALGFARGKIDHERLAALDEVQWRAVYRFTVTHFVTALAFARVSQLPREAMPGRGVLIEWMVHADKVAADNRRIAAATCAFAALMADHGIRPIILKGAGIAMFWPDPSLREASDVDIFLGGKFAEGNEAMRSLGIVVTDRYSETHNEFVYKGVLLENHRTLVNAYYNAASRRVEAALHRILAAEGTRRVEIGGGATGAENGTASTVLPPCADPRQPSADQRASVGELASLGCEAQAVRPGRDDHPPHTVDAVIPGPRFNALHVAHHMATHFAGGGILLRHLCDWTCMVQAGQVDFEQLRRDAPAAGFIRFVDALTGICIDRLGLAEHLAPGIVRDARLEVRILAEILASDGKQTFHDKGDTALSVIRYKAAIYFRRGWKHKLIYNEHPAMRAVHTLRMLAVKPAKIVHK